MLYSVSGGMRIFKCRKYFLHNYVVQIREETLEENPRNNYKKNRKIII